MKRKFLNKFKKWAISIGIASIFGLVAVANNQYQNYQKANAEEYPIISQPYNVNYNDDVSQIELSADELNNYTFSNLQNYLIDNYSILNSDMFYMDSYIIYNSVQYNGSGITSNGHLTFIGPTANLTMEFGDNAKWHNYDNNVEQNYEYSIVYHLKSDVYSGFKNAIKLDIQANQNPSSSGMGTQIIGTIGEGLGLISDLASEFLTGFTTLFYQNGALTNFAIFSLVMLGIAITMAVIKLVLSILRSNTGA